MRKCFNFLFFFVLWSANVFTADSVPTDIQMPGTQPMEIGSLDSPNHCDNCHGGYNNTVEPMHNWRGSAMSLAGRDPIFWAAVAIAEQDFGGAGDLCIRCHSTTGWLAGRSIPTDGSALAAGDSEGVDCDYCHKLTNPDDSEHPGVMTPPFIANDGVEGYYGSGMSSMSGLANKLGPYGRIKARHKVLESTFHRNRDFCGTCHDVSNPVTGDLALNHGQALDPDPVTASGIPGAAVDGKAAFNNPPYAYGVTERTFSEYQAGLIRDTLVDAYPGLPPDLQGGVLEQVYNAATANGTHSGNYLNPAADRYFSCQSCHMRPVTGAGANKQGVPTRTDLPLHDLTGGNYWLAEVIEYLDGQGKLLLGGDMSPEQDQAMVDGANRAREQLRLAATLLVDEVSDTVKVVNHAGHKLISGYPEGRRMWLNIKWYDGADSLLREDGRYGAITAHGMTVNTLLDPTGTNTRVWQAKMGITQDWANQLLGFGYDAGLALSYDRETGAVLRTLGDVAAEAPGTVQESFHLVLNNAVVNDNRIPPYGMSHDIAAQRNALPVPAGQFGGGAPGSVYDYFDVIQLAPPPDAAYATMDLLYQPTSWEYIQFLWLANNGTDPGQGGNAFLGNAGDDMLDAWLNTGMAEPFVMASAIWGETAEDCAVEIPVITKVEPGDRQNRVHWNAAAEEAKIGYSVYYDLAGKAQWLTDSPCILGLCGYLDSGLTNGQEYCYKLTARTESCASGFSDVVCGTPGEVPQPPAGMVSLESGQWVKEGKGGSATTTWVPGSLFAQGEKITFLGQVTDADGAPVSGANFYLEIFGPEEKSLTSGNSDIEGYADTYWSTRKPRKNGSGGTATGLYTARISGLAASGHDWDGVAIEIVFTIDTP